MSELTLDEVIKHCLEVAEENDLAAGMYELLAENNYNVYEKLTAKTNSSRCTECAENHRQLAEWLTELKDLREENTVLTSECYRLIKEKGELLKQHEQIVEYKRLLKAAMEDMNTLYEAGKDEGCIGIKFKWRFADKALKLIGDESSV